MNDKKSSTNWFLEGLGLHLGGVWDCLGPLLGAFGRFLVNFCAFKIQLFYSIGPKWAPRGLLGGFWEKLDVGFLMSLALALALALDFFFLPWGACPPPQGKEKQNPMPMPRLKPRPLKNLHPAFPNPPCLQPSLPDNLA